MKEQLTIETGTPTMIALPSESAARAVADLRKGHRVLGMTRGQFSLLDLIRAVLEITGPAAVQLSTWTAGIRDVRNVGLLLDASIITDFRMIVDRSFATRQPAYCAAVKKIFGPEAVRCTKTHAKIALIRNAEWAVTIRSSMNLNRNPRFEQFDIDESPAIWAFFNEHFDEIAGATPPGFAVSNAEIDAVFDRVGRGVSPFQSAVAMPNGRVSEWVARRLKMAGTTRTKVAKAVGVSVIRLMKALDDESEVALREDVVRELS